MLLFHDQRIAEIFLIYGCWMFCCLETGNFSDALDNSWIATLLITGLVFKIAIAKMKVF